MIPYNQYLYLDSVLVYSVLGPLSGTGVDNELVRWNGTDYHHIQSCPGVGVDDSGQMYIGDGASSPCSLLEIWDDDADPVLSITAAHATDYDPQAQFRTDVTDTVKCSLGVDSGDSDKFKIYMGEGIGDTSQFVIDSSGKVAIGTDTGQTLFTMAGTAPYLTLWNTTETDASNARESYLTFKGEESDGTLHTLVQFRGQHDGSGSDQLGKCSFYINSGAQDNSPSEVFRIASGQTYLYGTSGSYPIQGVFSYSDTSWHGCYYNFYRYRGTSGAPTVLLNADTLFNFSCWGYDGSATQRGGRLQCAVDGSVSAGAVPMRWEFLTGESGTSPSVRMVIKATGYIGLGDEISPETIIELTHASPHFTFHCSTETDAADSGMCKLLFKREQSGGEETTHAAIYAAHDGSSDDQKGYIALCTNDGSDGNVPTEAMRIDSNREMTISGKTYTMTVGDDDGRQLTSSQALKLQATGAQVQLRSGNYNIDFVNVDGILAKMTVDSDGNCILVAGEGTNGGVDFRSSGTGDIGFQDSSSVDLMYIDTTAGYIGIGAYETAPETLVEMTHASPFMTFHCSTETDAADSGMCKLLFKREQSGGEETTHAAIYAAHDGSSDDQKGYIAFLTNSGTDGDAPTKEIKMSSDGYIAFKTAIGYLGLSAASSYTITVGRGDTASLGTYANLQCDILDANTFRNNSDLGIDFDCNGLNPASTFFVRQARYGTPITWLTILGTTGYVGLGGETSPETLIEMTNASPFFTFHCDTESDAADSGMCKLLFKREQSGGEETTHAAIYAAHDGSSDDQKGYQVFCTNSGTDGNSPTERMRIDSNGNVSIGYALAASTVRLQVSDGTNVGTDWVSQFDVFAVTGEDINFAFVDTDSGTWGGGLGLKQVDGTVYENAWGIIRQTNGDGIGDGSLRFTYGTDASISNNSALVTILPSGNVGISQTIPTQKLDVTGNINISATCFLDTLDSTHALGTGLPTSSDANIIVRDSTAVAAGVGGGIVFTGKYTGSTYLSGAPYIRTSKESAVDGQYGFALTFGTREHSQACSEKLRIMGNGNVGVGVSDPDSQTEIASSAAGVTALHLKAHASQTANIFTVTDSSDNNLAWITAEGKIQSDTGLRTTANDWGDGLATWSYGEYTAEHTITDDAGNFDATGNANGEKYFYDTTNSPFTQDDEDNRNWIVIQSGTFKGAKAEILEYISADGVLLHSHGSCWDEDLSSVDYKIVKAPQFITSACYDTHIHVGTSGQVHIGNSGGTYTGDVGVEIEFSMGADNSDAFHIHCDAGGYSNCDAVQIFYDTGALQSGDLTQVMQITLDETGASGGTIACIHFDTTDQSAAEKRAICVGVGFDEAFCVAGSSSEDPDYGYEVTSGSVVDRVNSGGAGDDAFVNAAVDQEIFDNDNDYILIGSDETFEVIEVILATVSSKDLVLEFYYSKAGGNWTQFYPDDSTQGFTRSGLISFSAPGDWTEDDEAEANGDITEGYYVKIVRTYSYVVPTLPTEDYFKTYAERAGDTGMKIRGDGAVKLPYLTGAPSSLENGLMWAESDGIHAYFNGSEEVLATV